MQPSGNTWHRTPLPATRIRNNNFIRDITDFTGTASILRLYLPENLRGARDSNAEERICEGRNRDIRAAISVPFGEIYSMKFDSASARLEAAFL